MASRKRLLKDIYEIETKPYPNIYFIWNKGGTGAIDKPCLILTPENASRIHLSVDMPYDFPLKPPTIACNSTVRHPNVIGSYVCASILKTNEGWTPAYTLKGVAIQILSFFSSETLEQDWGDAINIQDYHSMFGPQIVDFFQCDKCGFNQPMEGDPTRYPKSRAWSSKTNQHETMDALTTATTNLAISSTVASSASPHFLGKYLSDLPDELLAEICKNLEDEDLINFAKSWDRIGGSNGVATAFNILHNRELRCFVLKTGFNESQLGIGVSVNKRSKKGLLESEFELLSHEAFKDLKVTRSVQGIPFTHWLPVPLSARHYQIVKPEVIDRLNQLSSRGNLGASMPAQVIYSFMNDVVVKLSRVHEESTTGPGMRPKSTLTHASEKAIDSYYHLFHLLLCLATENKAIVREANTKLQDFQAGKTGKLDCPNLGQLLLRILVADVELTEEAMKAIIQEAITRNVVWMLDRRGHGMVDLAYLEPDEISEYRLAKTFEASKTSYRLLMFFNLFRNTVDRGTGIARKSLEQMRDELFDSHGAPPLGTSAKLASEVKAVQGVNDFFSFLGVMGIEGLPTRKVMTGLLRKCVRDSMSKGYSVWGVSPDDAKAIRENDGKLPKGGVESFFPRWRGRNLY